MPDDTKVRPRTGGFGRRVPLRSIPIDRRTIPRNGFTPMHLPDAEPSEAPNTLLATVLGLCIYLWLCQPRRAISFEVMS